jgi:hypothetical protein
VQRGIEHVYQQPWPAANSQLHHQQAIASRQLPAANSTHPVATSQPCDLAVIRLREAEANLQKKYKFDLQGILCPVHKHVTI